MRPCRNCCHNSVWVAAWMDWMGRRKSSSSLFGDSSLLHKAYVAIWLCPLHWHAGFSVQRQDSHTHPPPDLIHPSTSRVSWQVDKAKENGDSNHMDKDRSMAWHDANHAIAHLQFMLDMIFFSTNRQKTTAKMETLLNKHSTSKTLLKCQC